MKKAFVYFATGFEELEAITICDVLRRAEIDTVMISITGNRVVTGAHAISVTTDILFEEADHSEAEILILPGGQPGANNLNAHDGLKQQVKEFAENGRKVAAICAAPLVLGGLNLLEGKDAVCYPGYENHLKGANLKYLPALRSGNIVTGRGPGAALDFALELVEFLKSKDIADHQARAMLVQTW